MHARKRQFEIISKDAERQHVLNEIRDIPDSCHDHDNNGDWVDANAVINGRAEINLSHAGGEFQELLEEELQPQKKQRENHAHQDAIVCRNLGFATQLNAMVNAYLKWSEL
ncbi:hypothetical protein C0992_011686 [Termitomyces sp. T32_za158]|nr:hypothetical protein C0992_011686 [Termitomyces sp. T32_za158]